MASEIGDKFPLLDALLGTDDTAKYTRDDLGDAMALLLLDAAHTTHELPSDPSAMRCLDEWRVRVMRETSTEPAQTFGDRVARYFERRPPKRELLAAIQLHLE